MRALASVETDDWNIIRTVPAAIPEDFMAMGTPSGNAVGSLTIFFLVINRVIGTGLFYSPVTVHEYTGNAVYSALMWLVGGLIAFATSLCWMELGLTVPITAKRSLMYHTPRSGGDKNYLEWLLSHPRVNPYSLLRRARKYFTAHDLHVVGLVVLMFGNMAANIISFASSVLSLQADTQQPASLVMFVSQLAAIGLGFSIQVHSPRAGIWLNNLLGALKVGLILLLIFLPVANLGAGWLATTTQATTGHPAAGLDFWGDPDVSEIGIGLGGRSSPGIFGAIVAIAFAYVGFELPLHVLSEPRVASIDVVYRGRSCSELPR